MPDGTELGRAKLRGIVSDGMILSETELELGDDADGIMVLGEVAGAGTPLAEVLPIAEDVLELDLNPNRVDLFGVYGVAREVHAITGAELAAPPWAADAEAEGDGDVADLASVRVEVPDLCPRFVARLFEGVEVRPSPNWLQARLRAAGQRPISNVVDVTNYVMLMTAQPLHAFDLDQVPGGEVIVRTARPGERMTTLDGVERALDAETVLVCDRNGPTGIAGIMGGQVSEVSESTTRVLLEVANWNGVNILRTSGVLGLRSEASTRFEKQLHPETALWAQRVASRLLVEIAGARLVPGTIDEAAEIPPAHVVSLHGARLDALLGIEVPRARAREHLEALEFEVADSGEADLNATVPLHRHYDVTREADLIEEVGRLEGFDRLPRRLPHGGDRAGRLTREQRLRRRAEDALRDLGFDEIVAWHFGPARAPTGCASIPPIPVAPRSPSRTPSPRTTSRCGRRCSWGCSTLPGTTSRAAPSAWRSSSPPARTSRSPRRGMVGRSPATSSGRWRLPSASRTASPASPWGPSSDPPGARPPRTPTSSS